MWVWLLTQQPNCGVGIEAEQGHDPQDLGGLAQPARPLWGRWPQIHNIVKNSFTSRRA